MTFFSKDRDLIHRIANLVLILWLVGAIFVFYTTLVDIVIKKPTLTYDEYKNEYCDSIYKPNNATTEEEYCERQYEQHKIDIKNENYYNKKGLMNAIGNVIIVGTFIFFLNRK